MSDNKKIDISVCMGSSCYPRGNRETLEKIKAYVSENNLSDQIMMRGNLCEGLCKDGPNIRINGTIYNDIDYFGVLKVIEEILKQEK
ncbi:MAG: (2Fe-2S) ferredoxin domain-containing protein [Candidatus Cloacimonadales bacterium]